MNFNFSISIPGTYAGRRVYDQKFCLYVPDLVILIVEQQPCRHRPQQMFEFLFTGSQPFTGVNHLIILSNVNDIQRKCVQYLADQGV